MTKIQINNSQAYSLYKAATLTPIEKPENGINCGINNAGTQSMQPVFYPML
jgi:hypothetical protein